MKKPIAVLLLCAMLFTFAACGDKPTQEADAPVLEMTLNIADGLPEHRISLTPVGTETSDGWLDCPEYLARVDMVRGTELADLTVQRFVIASYVEPSERLLTVSDLDFDGYGDLVVRCVQTVHSAAIFKVYRWQPERSRFEAEPFFEYTSSTEPVVYGGRYLLTQDITAASTEYTVYALENDRYELLRIQLLDRDGSGDRYSIYEYDREQDMLAPTPMYSARFDVGEGEAAQERLRRVSLLLYGDDYTLANKAIELAEDYCHHRIMAKSGGFDRMAGSLMCGGEIPDDLLYNSERQYALNDAPDAVTADTLATGFDPTAPGLCRVSVAAVAALDYPRADGKAEYRLENLSVEVSFGEFGMYISDIGKAIHPSEDTNAFLGVYIDEDGDVVFDVYGEGHVPQEQPGSRWLHSRMGTLRFVESGLLCLHRGVGTGLWIDVYRDPSADKTSESLMCSRYLGGGVIMLLRGGDTVVLCDVFDDGSYRFEIPIGAVPTGNPSDSVRSCEIIDSTHIRLCYLSSDWEEVTREIEIPPAEGQEPVAP